MTTHEGIRRFAGICVGGPYDGMMQAHWGPTLKVAQGPVLPLSRVPGPINLIVKMGTYEFDAGEDGRQSEWRWKGWS